MTKTKKMRNLTKAFFLIIALMLAVGLALPAAGVAFAVTPPPSPTTQLGMILDGSGSISDAEWDIMKEGLASAVESTSFPKDGSVDLTIVQIGGYSARLDIGPVVVTEANASNVASQIRSISKIGSSTPLACGFYLLADVMSGAVLSQQRSPTSESGDFSHADRAYYDNNDNSSYATATNGEQNRYYGYGFSIPDGATINGIEVRLDAWRKSDPRTGSLAVEVSWNNGSSWTTTGYGTPALTSSQDDYYVGGASDTWSPSHTWTPDEINNSFRVRLTATAGGSSAEVYLD